MTPADKTRFFGIHAATVCPMKADGSIDETALADHLRPLAQVRGLAGFLVNGHAGENYLLGTEEKRLVLEIARETVGDKLIVAGVNQEDSRAAAAEAEQAMAAGADAVMLFPPMSWALGHDTAMALHHHEIIVAATDAPLFLYQAPVGAGHLAYTPKTLQRLARLPSVVGIKEGSWETAAYEANRRLVRSVAPDVGVMASGDEHLLTCFLLGSEGSLVSIACIWPEPVIRLEAAVGAGDLEAARAAHEEIYPLARAIYGTAPGYRATARLKACLHLMGRIPSDHARPPIERLPREEIEQLERLLRAHGHL